MPWARVICLAIAIPTIALAASSQSPARTNAAPDRQREFALRLLATAEAEAGAFDAPMRSAALLMLGHVYAAVDKTKSAKLLEEAYDIAARLPANNPPGMSAITTAAVAEMASVAPAKVEANMPADAGLRRVAVRALLDYYIGHKQLRRAQEIYRTMDDVSVPDAAGALLAAIPKSQSAERNAVFSQAIGAFRRADQGFAFGSAGLPGTVVREWRDLDPRLVENAIDVFLEQAKDTKAHKDGELGSPSIEATSGMENIRFSSPYEFRLFQFLPILQKLNPGRAEALLRDEQNLASVMGRFPEGQASFDPAMKSAAHPEEGQTTNYVIDYSGRPRGLMPSAGQQRAADLNRVVSFSEKDPNTAITQAIMLPDAERADALVAIARARLHDDRSSAERAMATYLKVPADRHLRATTAQRAVETFLELDDSKSAEAALDMLLKAIEFDYKKDSDPDDPNTALKLAWASTYSWGRAVRVASRISPDAALAVFKSIPDPEIKTIEEIALAGEWLKVPATARYLNMVIMMHKTKQ